MIIDKYSEHYWIVDKETGINAFGNNGFSNIDSAIRQLNREYYKNPISGSYLVVVNKDNRIVYEVEE